MQQKPKVAIYWLGACAGCDEAIVDLNESDSCVTEPSILFCGRWPWTLSMTTFRSMEGRGDRPEHPDGFGEKFRPPGDGGVVAKEIPTGPGPWHMRLLRREPGACKLQHQRRYIQLGLPGCAHGRQSKRGFSSTRDRTRRRESSPFRMFFEHVYTLDQIIDVDYFLPGCPPPPDLITNAINSVLTGDLPPKGSTLAPRKALCDTCPRNKRKPSAWRSGRFKRIHEVETDPETVSWPRESSALAQRPAPGAGRAASGSMSPARLFRPGSRRRGVRTQVLVHADLLALRWIRMRTSRKRSIRSTILPDICTALPSPHPFWEEEARRNAWRIEHDCEKDHH